MLWIRALLTGWIAAVSLVACSDRQEAAPHAIKVSATPDTSLATEIATHEIFLTPTPTICLPNPAWQDTYTVQPGDTLGAIAIAAGVTLKDMQEGNCLVNRDVLMVGQVLQVPNAFSIGLVSSPEGAAGVVIFVRNGDLWTLNLSSSAIRQITRSQVVAARPMRSPNLEWVAFSVVSPFYLPPAYVATATPTIEPTPETTTTATAVAESTSDSPKQSTPEPEPLFDPQTLAGLPTDIWTVGVDGNELSRVVDQGPREPIYRSEPVWSPDSEWLAFTEQGAFVGSLIVIHRDGTERTVVLTGDFTPPGEKIPVAPAWSPDGRSIAFISWDEQDRAGLQTVSPVARADDVENILTGFAYHAGLLWVTSEDNMESVLAYTAFNAALGQAEWHVIDPETKTEGVRRGGLALAAPDRNWMIHLRSDGLTLIGPDEPPSIALPADINNLAWGPEGAQLIVGGATTGMVLFDLNKNAEQRVTNDYDLLPAWVAPVWVLLP